LLYGHRWVFGLDPGRIGGGWAVGLRRYGPLKAGGAGGGNLAASERFFTRLRYSLGGCGGDHFGGIGAGLFVHGGHKDKAEDEEASEG